jgi:hypothetical protein
MNLTILSLQLPLVQQLHWLEDPHMYHSILGINDKNASTICMAKLRTRLDGVNYMFLDEVSMLSYHDMYDISA